ncbi:hypothetical protein ACFMQL_10940 [Nonomuraea fastidiosa]|uniref:hypothetical protein n=1 Tax=Nonomuraea TaxID=83681 RepID=UPI00324E7F2A
MTASRSSVRLARTSWTMPISALATMTSPNRPSCHSPKIRISAQSTPMTRLNRVSTFALRMALSDLLERRGTWLALALATWADVSPWTTEVSPST